MAARDINEVSYDEATTVEKVSETVQGQPQSAPRELDDGKVSVNEYRVKLDTQVLDPNAPEAVVIPEGVGARADEDALLSDVYSAGTADEQFASSAAPKQAPRRAKSDDGDKS